MDGFPDNKNITDRLADESAVILMTGSKQEYELFTKHGMYNVLV